MAKDPLTPPHVTDLSDLLYYSLNPSFLGVSVVVIVLHIFQVIFFSRHGRFALT